MSTRNIVPRNDGEGNIGTQVKQWIRGYFYEVYTNSLTNGVVSVLISQIKSAIDNSHVSHSDDQDLSGLVLKTTQVNGFPLSGDIVLSIDKKLNSNFTTTVVTATGTNLSFPMAANEIWVVEVELTTQCSGTGGVKYSIGSSTGATIEGWILSSLGAITTLSYQRITAINTLNSTALHTVANTPAPDRIRFVITNGATAGNCVINAASNTNGQTTTIFNGSSLSARKANSV